MNMENEDTVEPQIDAMEAMEQEAPEVSQAEGHDEAQVAQEEPKQVPLSALQKERKKRQELELELQWVKQNQQQIHAPVAPPEEDNSKYESATREDLSRTQNETIRAMEERLWIRSNPEKYEKVNEYLPKFLEQRPNLKSAIRDAPNRYEEAYTLMEALTPKQQQQLKAAPAQKKEAPGSPGSVPKAAALNQTVDVMNMSDSEFTAWRTQQKKRR